MPLKKLLVISYYWPPAGGAGVQRCLKFVRHLPEFGYEPIVITVDDRVATYPVTDPTLQADIPAGVRVIRTRSFEPLSVLSRFVGKENVPYGGFANTRKESRVQRLLRWVRGNFFIPDARKGWVPHALKEATRIINEEQIERVMISSPPHSSQLIGLQLKKRFPSLTWIADMRDPWTDIYYYKDLMHTQLAARADSAMERQVLETADLILVVSEPIRQTFLKKSDTLNGNKIAVIPNGYDADDFHTGKRERTADFTISYVGTLAESYHPEVFIDVLNRFAATKPQDKVSFRFVGNIPWNIRERFEQQARGWKVLWTGHVPHLEATRAMQNADMLLLVIPDVPGADGILTGKLFEYIGSETPILGMGPCVGEASRILTETQAGTMFERTDVSGMVAFIEQVFLRRDDTAAASQRSGNATNYSRYSLTEKLTGLIEAARPVR
ncbi:MAG: glycosyltransferase family 4 protein [Sphingobacteriales bacterium]|nr:glycosyltransferase family 4 protein [Sphingobacteriales bacterium]